MGRCSNYNFEESKSRDCFHMVLRKHAFSDLVRMKWRIGIWTKVRGSETLLFSIEMLLQYFDCPLSFHILQLCTNENVWIAIPVGVELSNKGLYLQT